MTESNTPDKQSSPLAFATWLASAPDDALLDVFALFAQWAGNEDDDNLKQAFTMRCVELRAEILSRMKASDVQSV